MRFSDIKVWVFIRFKSCYDMSYSSDAYWKGNQCVMQKVSLLTYLSMRSDTISRSLVFVKEIQLIKLKPEATTNDQMFENFKKWCDAFDKLERENFQKFNVKGQLNELMS